MPGLVDSLKREKSKGNITLIYDLKLFDHDLFFKQFHVSIGKLEEVLSRVPLKIVKSDVIREPIGPEETKKDS